MVILLSYLALYYCLSFVFQLFCVLAVDAWHQRINGAAVGNEADLVRQHCGESAGVSAGRSEIAQRFYSLGEHGFRRRIRIRPQCNSSMRGERCC